MGLWEKEQLWAQPVLSVVTLQIGPWPPQQEWPSPGTRACTHPSLPSCGHPPSLLMWGRAGASLRLWEPGWGVLTSLLPLFLNCGLQKLISAIYADYARSLKNLGFKQGAVLFASKAGAAGRDLLNELECPKQEPAEE